MQSCGFFKQHKSTGNRQRDTCITRSHTDASNSHRVTAVVELHAASSPSAAPLPLPLRQPASAGGSSSRSQRAALRGATRQEPAAEGAQYCSIMKELQAPTIPSLHHTFSPLYHIRTFVLLLEDSASCKVSWTGKAASCSTLLVDIVVNLKTNGSQTFHLK